MFLHLSCGDGGEGQRRARVCARGARSAGRRRLARARAPSGRRSSAGGGSWTGAGPSGSGATSPRRTSSRPYEARPPPRSTTATGRAGGGVRRTERGARGVVGGVGCADPGGAAARIADERDGRARAPWSWGHPSFSEDPPDDRIDVPRRSPGRRARVNGARVDILGCDEETRRRPPGKSLSATDFSETIPIRKKCNARATLDLRRVERRPTAGHSKKSSRSSWTGTAPSWDGPTARRRRHTQRRVRARTHARAFDPARAPRVASARPPRVRLCRARPSPPWVPRR